MLELLTAAEGAIIAEDEHALTRYLQAVPIQELKTKTNEHFLSYFLDLAYKSRNSKAVRQIIERWDEENYDYETRPTVTTILTLPKLQGDEFFKFYGHANPDVDFIDHVLNLLNYGPGPRLELACSRLRLIYGRQSPEIYDLARKQIEISQADYNLFNYALSEFIEDQYREYSGVYAVIPDWIIPNASSHQELLSGLPKAQKPNLRKTKYQIAQILSQDMIINYDDHEYLEDQILQDLFDMPRKEMISILEKTLKIRSEADLGTDPEIFRVLGPSHPVIGNLELDSESSDPSMRYGGYRLILSPEDEDDDDELEGLSLDWFTGSCDYCAKQIRAKHHALRMPLEQGGWLGCYCSFDCIRGDSNNSFILLLVDSIEKDYYKYGIYDRTWSEIVVEEVIVPSQDYNNLLRTIMSKKVNHEPILVSTEAIIETNTIPRTTIPDPDIQARLSLELRA